MDGVVLQIMGLKTHGLCSLMITCVNMGKFFVLLNSNLKYREDNFCIAHCGIVMLN